MENLKFAEKQSTKGFHSIYNKMLNLFKVETNFQLIEYFKKIKVKQNSVCKKNIFGGFFCKNCATAESSIICDQCFNKGDHIGHQIEKKIDSGYNRGICDCGDTDGWKESGFCTDHKGVVTDNQIIQEIINKSFPGDVKSALTEILDEFFLELSLLVRTIEVEKKSQKSIQNYIEKLNEAISNLDILCESNEAMRYFVVEFFIKKYPVLTTHECISITHSKQSNDFSFIIIPNSKEPHYCECSFLRNVLEIYDKDLESSFKIDTFLFNSLSSHVFKFNFAITYLLLKVEKNKKMKEYSFQIYSNSIISSTILDSDSYMNFIFKDIKKKVSLYDLENNKTDFLPLLHDLQVIYVNLLTIVNTKTIHVIENKFQYLLYIIDILSIINHKNSLKFSENFINDAYLEDLIMVELYFLCLFVIFTSGINFDNQNECDKVLTYILDRIILSWKSKSHDTFSYHLPLNRCFSIFICRYAMNKSLFQNLDYYSASQKIIEKLSNKVKDKFNLREILHDILKETLRFIGFINSIQFNYWISYGDNIKFYFQNYYSLAFYEIFFFCDGALIKFLISSLNHQEINMLNFLEEMNIIKVPQEQGQIINLEPSQLKFIEKNYEMLLHLVVNENIFFDLIFYVSDRGTHLVFADKILTKFLKSDENSINILIQRRLANLLMIKDSPTKDEIFKLFPIWMRMSLQNNIDANIEDICFKNEKNNSIKSIYFHLKSKYFNLLDNYSVRDPKKKKMFLTNLADKSNGCPNTLHSRAFFYYPNMKSLETVFKLKIFEYNFIYQAISFLDMISKKHVNDDKIVNLMTIYLKSLDLAFNLTKTSNVLNDIKRIDESCETESFLINEKRQELIVILENIKVNNSGFKEQIEYLIQKLTNNTLEYNFNIKSKPINSVVNLNLKKNKSVITEESSDLERSSEETVKDLKDISKIECCKCHMKININETINYPFCKIGLVSNTHFLFHSRLQTFRNLYRAHPLRSTEKENLLAYESLFNVEEDFSNLVIISCNHYIHFECFEAIMSAKIVNYSEIYFLCPKCSAISNLLIPYYYPNNDKLYRSSSIYEDDLKNTGNDENFSMIPTFFYTGLELYLKKLYHTFTFKQLEIDSINDSYEGKNDDLIYEEFNVLFINLMNNIKILGLNAMRTSFDAIRSLSFSFRFMANSNKIKVDFYKSKLKQILYYWKFIGPEIILNLIESNSIENFILEFCFISSILSNCEDFDKNLSKIYLNYLPFLILKYIYYKFVNEKGFFLKKLEIVEKLEKLNLDDFLYNEEKKIDVFLYPILLKLTILSQIFGVNNSFLHLNPLKSKNIDEKIQYCNQRLNLKSNIISLQIEEINSQKIHFIDLFNKLKNILIESINTDESSNLVTLIDPNLFLFPLQEYSFSFITLPDCLIDLYLNYSQEICENCKTSPRFSIICLLCGKKLCYVPNCCNNFGPNKDLYEFKVHGQICAKGVGCFITMHSGKILYLLEDKYKLTNQSPYRNKLGEINKSKNLSNEYVLKQDIYNSIFLEYKKFQFLKNFDTE